MTPEEQNAATSDESTRTAPIGFEVFYADYRPRLLRFVRKTARDNNYSESWLDAESVVQDVFEQALRTWDRIEQPAHWIFRVAGRQIQRHATEEWKRIVRRNYPGDAAEMLVALADPDPTYTHVVAHRAMDEIMKLPTNQRIATYLAHVEQWTGAEIAELLGVTPNTVYSHIHRGVTTVRAQGSLIITNNDIRSKVVIRSPEPAWYGSRTRRAFVVSWIVSMLALATVCPNAGLIAMIAAAAAVATRYVIRRYLDARKE
ncbi:RNA polymerase sigma factor [Nocardia sp. NPDC005825]|uniref:RNA polymerase sigma factor n=1 Tax=unclassified Nocardia TaxID=2637762 RepID=UPI0033E0B6A5